MRAHTSKNILRACSSSLSEILRGGLKSWSITHFGSSSHFCFRPPDGKAPRDVPFPASLLPPFLAALAVAALPVDPPAICSGHAPLSRSASACAPPCASVCVTTTVPPQEQQPEIERSKLFTVRAQAPRHCTMHAYYKCMLYLGGSRTFPSVCVIAHARAVTGVFLKLRGPDPGPARWHQLHRLSIIVGCWVALVGCEQFSPFRSRGFPCTELARLWGCRCRGRSLWCSSVGLASDAVL